MTERRRLIRWQINRSGKLNFKELTKALFCQIKDINCAGAQISLQAKLPLDTKLEMTFKLSENYTVEANVWVTWHKVVNGCNHYGLYFNQIKDADKDKINKFIRAFYPDTDPREMPKRDSVAPEELEGGEDLKDHRIFERFSRAFSARFIGLDGKEGAAQTFDVSAKGLGLATSQPLDAQANLEIWLDVPNSTEPVYTRGQVVWTGMAESRGYRSGIELERADLMGISRLLRA